MSFLLDTSVVSELVRKIPHEGVVNWLGRQDEDTLYLSVLTLGELEKGISKLKASARRDRLRMWVSRDLAARFSDRFLSIDVRVAARWGALTPEIRRKEACLCRDRQPHCGNRVGARPYGRDAKRRRLRALRGDLHRPVDSARGVNVQRKRMGKNSKLKDKDLRGSQAALERAARSALEIARATRTPCYVLKRGKIVDIAAVRRPPRRSAAS